MSGGTRLLVDTDGVGGVPVDGGQVVTNRWGTGVVTDISSYYRNTTSVDLKRLPDDVEATRSVVESALTEGAIGYRKFSVLKGKRLFAILRLADGSQPPFGASVTSEKGRELGMVRRRRPCLAEWRDAGGNPVGKLGWKNTVSGKCTGDSNI